MEELNNLIFFLKNIIKEHSIEEDNEEIKCFVEKINDIKNKIPTLEELEELRKLEIDLETRHDALNELGIYFDPLYIKIKRIIHDDYVRKIRQTNKKKKGIN